MVDSQQWGFYSTTGEKEKDKRSVKQVRADKATFTP
jgi:hypothetical protein